MALLGNEDGAPPEVWSMITPRDRQQAARQHNSLSPLFRLPAEIRLLIYSYLISPHQVDLISDLVAPSLCPSRRSSGHLTLLLTCAHLYADLLPIAYRATVFYLAHHPDKGRILASSDPRPRYGRAWQHFFTFAYPALSSSVRSIRPSVLRHITNLALSGDHASIFNRAKPEWLFAALQPLVYVRQVALYFDRWETRYVGPRLRETEWFWRRHCPAAYRMLQGFPRLQRVAILLPEGERGDRERVDIGMNLGHRRDGTDVELDHIRLNIRGMATTCIGVSVERREPQQRIRGDKACALYRGRPRHSKRAVGGSVGKSMPRWTR